MHATKLGHHQSANRPVQEREVGASEEGCDTRRKPLDQVQGHVNGIG